MPLSTNVSHKKYSLTNKHATKSKFCICYHYQFYVASTSFKNYYLPLWYSGTSIRDATLLIMTIMKHSKDLKGVTGRTGSKTCKLKCQKPSSFGNSPLPLTEKVSSGIEIQKIIYKGVLLIPQSILTFTNICIISLPNSVVPIKATNYLLSTKTGDSLRSICSHRWTILGKKLSRIFLHFSKLSQKYFVGKLRRRSRKMCETSREYGKMFS